jgi:hypothetical protein
MIYQPKKGKYTGWFQNKSINKKNQRVQRPSGHEHMKRSPFLEEKNGLNRNQ